MSYRANKEHPGRLTEGPRFGHQSWGYQKRQVEWKKSGGWEHSLEGHGGALSLPLPAFASQLP